MTMWKDVYYTNIIKKSGQIPKEEKEKKKAHAHLSTREILSHIQHKCGMKNTLGQSYASNINQKGTQ